MLHFASRELKKSAAEKYIIVLGTYVVHAINIKLKALQKQFPNFLYILDNSKRIKIAIFSQTKFNTIQNYEAEHIFTAEVTWTTSKYEGMVVLIFGITFELFFI